MFIRYGAYVNGLTKQKLATLDDCSTFLASLISASQSFGSQLHAIVTFDIVRVPRANPAAMRCDARALFVTEVQS